MVLNRLYDNPQRNAKWKKTFEVSGWIFSVIFVISALYKFFG